MTFAGRGVAAPFTTPLLAGTRVRESTRSELELVVPNPSGGRGVYVLNWSGVRALCNPTLHDAVLSRQFSGLAVLDPARVRDAALQVALEGHAGREAAAAAGVAISHDRTQRLTAHFLLVSGLVEQLDPHGRKVASSPERMADLDRRASVVLHRIAPSLGRPAAQLADGVMAVGAMFAPIGIAAGDRDARIPRLLIRLEESLTDLSRWLEADPENDVGGLGSAVAAAMRRACDSGSAVLEKTRMALTGPTNLLKCWTTDPDVVLARAMRCDWLLDGWERIGLLWLSAGTGASRRAALLEMAPLVPVLPREVMEWTDMPVPEEAMKQANRVTSNQDGWRTGRSAFALIERNEKILAMSI
jgi:hypothetical protein